MRGKSRQNVNWKVYTYHSSIRASTYTHTQSEVSEACGYARVLSTPSHLKSVPVYLQMSIGNTCREESDISCLAMSIVGMC